MVNFVHDSSNGFPPPDPGQAQNATGSKLNSHKLFDKKSFYIRKLFKPKALVSVFVLFLLMIGGVSAFILTQTSQDVRQQASGCTYWNGEAAVEGAVDNRGGIRQECKNGLWDVPADGNLDPSEIVAQQQAEKDKLPKEGCVNWKGETVSHGSIDNRGGIRQECKNGLWDVPADGNLDPSEIIAQENEGKPKNGCVSWDGSEVSHGAYEDRGGIRQQCINGLWDAPDDGITDPRGGIDQISNAIGGLDEGKLDYAEARETYDKFCRNNIESQSVDEVCDALDASLRESAQIQRYTALDTAVKSNNDVVSTALGKLDEGDINITEAKSVYDSYCNPSTAGSNYNYTSVSVCDALEMSLQQQAAKVGLELLSGIADEVKNRVNYAIEALQRGIMDPESAQSAYDENCTGVETSGSEYCKNLAVTIQEQAVTESQDCPDGSQSKRACEQFGDPCLQGNNGCWSPATLIDCPDGTQSKRACEKFGDPCSEDINGCWSPIDMELPERTCSDGSGLFSGSVSNSHSCLYFGASYYECDSGYENKNGRCSLIGPGYVGPCCVDGEYKTTCREEDRDGIPQKSSDCQSKTGDRCVNNDDCGFYSRCIVSPNGRFCVDLDAVSTGSCGDGICSSDETFSSCASDCQAECYVFDSYSLSCNGDPRNCNERDSYSTKSACEERWRINDYRLITEAHNLSCPSNIREMISQGNCSGVSSDNFAQCSSGSETYYCDNNLLTYNLDETVFLDLDYDLYCTESSECTGGLTCIDNQCTNDLNTDYESIGYGDECNNTACICPTTTVIGIGESCGEENQVCEGQVLPGDTVYSEPGTTVTGKDSNLYRCEDNGSWTVTFDTYDYPVVQSVSDQAQVVVILDLEEDYPNIDFRFDSDYDIDNTTLMRTQREMELLNPDVFSDVEVEITFYAEDSRTDFCQNRNAGGCATTNSVRVREYTSQYSDLQVVTHELIHAVDDHIITSEYCPTGIFSFGNSSCTILEAYVEVAALDGINLYTTDNPVGDSYRDSPVESLAWECSEYRANPDQLADTPNVQEFCSMFFN